VDVLKYDKNKIIIMGISIGSGPATYLASKTENFGIEN
jgi:hypothetical protein